MKLLLVDGHYHVYRAFHAIPHLTNSRGEPTNAIFGFTKALRRMVHDLAPDLGAVIWDEGLPARRTQLQPAYKQQRPPMPEPMRPQLAEIRALVPLLGFKSLAVPDTEADDLLAAYAVAAVAAGHEVVLATNDKDLFQIVAPNVRVYSTNKTAVAAPGTGYALLGPAAVEAKWGVPPDALADLLALTGDPSDNIPGIEGLGPKGAARLLAAAGSLEALLAHPEHVPNERLRERLIAGATRVRQNREMVRLDTDLPLPAPLADLRLAPQPETLLAALDRFEFRSLGAEVRAELGGGRDPATTAPDNGPATVRAGAPSTRRGHTAKGGRTPGDAPDAPRQGELF